MSIAPTVMVTPTFVHHFRWTHGRIERLKNIILQERASQTLHANNDEKSEQVGNGLESDEFLHGVDRWMHQMRRDLWALDMQHQRLQIAQGKLRVCGF